jgi:pimeloyl-ACP methyl ester carboxylesterase
MPIADGRSDEKPEPVSPLRLLSVMSLFFLVGACASSGPHTINMMPAPSVFAGGEINPLPAGTPPVSYDDFPMFYATDRKPAESPYEYPFYLNEQGFVLRLGTARIKAGPEGMDWEEVRRITLDENRTTDYPLQVLSVDETGVLASTVTVLNEPDPPPTTPDQAGRDFAELIDKRLADSGVKDVYIYVHGYRVVFDDPLLIAAELWHFLGYRGAFIAYAWRSTPRALAFASDTETAVARARNFRLFLTYLAEKTQVERIHIIGFSAGTRLVLRALEQLAFLHTDATDEQIRRNVRIGSVVFVGGDSSREAFGAAMADGVLRIPERFTIYVSSADSALNWSQWIFSRERIGQMWTDGMPPRVAEFVAARPYLEFIDVTEAAGSTSGNGHGYFRQSPYVSSDILTFLAYDIEPDRRGLVKAADDLPVWTFPPDYIERLRKVLKEMSPSLAGG